MKVLFACEYSGIGRDEFIRVGHDAWSCDLIPSESARNKDRHFQADCMEVIASRRWDLIIMHPPCTKISLCGNSTYGRGMPKHEERISALDWTQELWNLAISECDKVVLENPRNVLGSMIGRRTQEIQPYQFGHPEQKATWLWLYGLSPLRPSRNVYDEMMALPKKQRERIFYMSPSATRGHDRSLSYQGIMQAMADQWGK